MKRNTESTIITVLGEVCNIISVIFTIIICLPLPIIFLFLKNTKRNFSISDNFKKYLNAEISLDTLRKNTRIITLRLIFMAVVFLLITWFMLSTNNSNEYEIRGNYIFGFVSISLVLLCYYLCFLVIKFTKNNAEIVKQNSNTII